MGEIRPPLPAKFFIGMLSPELSLFDACAEVLRGEYGSVDIESAVFPWDGTDYYRDEMGGAIYRKFLFLQRLLDPAALPSVKKFTNTLEDTFSLPSEGPAKRRINLDPGYVTEAKVVLATTKDFSHRLYIGCGIYAEVTLRYSAKDRQFMPHELTYPDFRREDYRTLFRQARENLRAGLGK